MARLTGYLDGTVVTNLQTQFRQWRSRIESPTDGLGLIIAEGLGLTQSQRNEGWIVYDYDTSLTDGTIQILERRGLLGRLRTNMEDAAVDQYVTASVCSLATFAAETGNQGALAVGSSSAESHCPTGTIHITCVDEQVSKPKLSVEIGLTTPLPDGTTSIRGTNQLTTRS